MLIIWRKILNPIILTKSSLHNLKHNYMIRWNGQHYLKHQEQSKYISILCSARKMFAAITSLNLINKSSELYSVKKKFTE